MLLVKRVIWTSIYTITYEKTKILQRKWGIDTKTKTIERESKNIMWVKKKKLSYKLSKNVCLNIISLVKNSKWVARYINELKVNSDPNHLVKLFFSLSFLTKQRISTYFLVFIPMFL